MKPRPVLALLASCATVLGAAGLVLLPAAAAPQPVPTATTSSLVTVRVAGNGLVDGAGHPVRLLGVNRAGTEYACAQGWGIFDGPTDTTAISAMTSWGTGAVRVPLNESCWLGINGVGTSVGGQAYRDAVTGYVQQLHAAGLAVILDLHWNAPGTQKALGQQVMADADHSPAFWTSVAGTFLRDPGVVFDLYNEPHDISWACWRDGCTTSAGWAAAGMQQLLDAVRATGATQPVLAGGMNYAGDLSQWLTHRPNDPANQLGASAHIYSFSQCSTRSCWDQTIAPVAATVPVVTTELGSDDCSPTFTTGYLDWADAHAISYVGWTWNTYDCANGPALISSYDGTPTAMGTALRSRLLASRASTGSVYDFERGTAPWQGEGPAAAAASTTAHGGTRSMELSVATGAADFALLRANDGGNSLTPSAGGLLTAWVLVPAGTPGTSWCASLQLQSSSYSWQGGSCTPLTPGAWTQVSFRPSSALWAGHRALGIQVDVAHAAAGTLRAVVDDVAQTP